MKRILAYISSFSLILVMIFMISHTTNTEKKTLRAQAGLMDARSWDFKEDGIFSLKGEWEIAKNEILSPKDFSESGSKSFIQVPVSWKEDTEVSTYRLTVAVPDDLDNIGLRIKNIWSAHRLFINGEMIKEQGKPASTKKDTINKNIPYEVYEELDSNEVEIVIQTSNFSNATSGIVQPIFFGSQNAISLVSHKEYTIEWMAVILLVVFALFHLSIFLLRQKDSTFYYSGLFLASLALMVATRNERVLSRIFPGISFEVLFTLQDLMTFGTIMLLILFLLQIEPKLLNKRTTIVAMLPPFLSVMIIIVLPARTTSHVQEEFSSYLNIFLFVLLFRFLWMAFRKRSTIYRNELWIFSGILGFLFVFTLGGVLDALRVQGAITPTRLALLGFAIMMNLFLANRLINRTEQSEKLSTSLKNANVMKDEFLAITSNELKTPLHGLMNIIRVLLQNRPLNLTNQQTEQLAIVKQMTEKLAYLVNDLQDFTKLRFNDLQLTKSTLDLRVMIEIVYDLLAFDFENKRLQFENCIPENVCVRGDENRVRQVLYNVLHNAMKYTSEGNITVSAVKMDDRIILYIEDTGTGIDPESIDSIFQFLYTDNNATSYYNNRGMGLGLYISQELLKMMDGNIWVERTRVGTGTIMAIALPIAEEQQNQTGNVGERNKPSRIKTWSQPLISDEQEKVLIVDDDPVNIQLLTTILEGSFTPIPAYSGQQALQLLNEHSDIRYVITDVMMQGMSGVELTKRIRERFSLMELPVIMSTVIDSPRDITLTFQVGANDYITKPFTKEAIIARLNAVRQIRASIQQALDHEMAFLQAQIKPHFLYNALSSIISFCYIDGERAAHLLTMLSSYLRYIFEGGREGHVTTLQQEIDVIYAYVTIEQARFGNRLSFQCDISDGVPINTMPIPSLLLQPLIENSIRHGLFDKEGEGEIRLSVSEISEGYQFIIEDNGIGMSQKQLDYITSGEDRTSGIGLGNVRRRIRQIQGANFSIQSEEGKGTKIVLVLPKKID